MARNKTVIPPSPPPKDTDPPLEADYRPDEFTPTTGDAAPAPAEVRDDPEADVGHQAANDADRDLDPPPPPLVAVAGGKVALGPFGKPKPIAPTVGRSIHYFPKGWTEAQQPCMAVVCHVHSDTLVNLCTFTPEGVPVPATNVLLCQPGEKRPKGGNYCAWMEYQVGAAKK